MAFDLAESVTISAPKSNSIEWNAILFLWNPMKIQSIKVWMKWTLQTFYGHKTILDNLSYANKCSKLTICDICYTVISKYVWLPTCCVYMLQAAVIEAIQKCIVCIWFCWTDISNTWPICVNTLVRCFWYLWQYFSGDIFSKMPSKRQLSRQGNAAGCAFGLSV